MDPNVLAALARGVPFNALSQLSEGWDEGRKQAIENANRAALAQGGNALAAGNYNQAAGQFARGGAPNAAVDVAQYPFLKARQQREDTAAGLQNEAQRALMQYLGVTPGGPQSGSQSQPMPPGWSGSSALDESAKLPGLYKRKAMAEAAGNNNASQAFGAEIARINNATDTSVKQQGVDIENKKLGLQMAGGEKRIAYGQDIQQQGAQGYDSLSNLARLEKYISDPNFISGKWTQLPRDAQRIIAAYGIDPNAATAVEGFQALNSKLAKDELGNMGSGISNSDRDFITAQFPGFDFSKASNQEIIQIRRAVAQRKIDIGNEATKYMEETDKDYLDKGWEKRQAQYAKDHPLFGTPANNPINNAQKDEAAKALGISREEYDRRARQNEGDTATAKSGFLDAGKIKEGALVEDENGFKYRKVNGQMVPQ